MLHLRLIRKVFRNNRGETLIEVMASILIASVSTALLFSCVMASSRIDMDAGDVDIRHYNALTAAETHGSAPPSPDPVTVTPYIEITNDEITPPAPVTIEVEIYGGEDMYSYKGVTS